MPSLPLRIGTRGSKLALIQANEVKKRLVAMHGFDDQAVEIVVIRTTGDRVTDRPLMEIGGKGLFTKEIERALFDGEIDLAVHSMKDMATVLPEGLEMAAYLPREDPRDAFLSSKAGSIRELPHGAVVGSSSIRRQAQLKRLRPDLDVVMYRGNVDTRLRKLKDGEVDATILALSGLKRMGLEANVTQAVPMEDMLPAVAQGAIGIQLRHDDARARDLVTPINHQPTEATVNVERAFLRVLDGSCRTPIAGHAAFVGETRISFAGMVLTPDGDDCRETSLEADQQEAVAMAAAAGEDLKRDLGPGFLVT